MHPFNFQRARVVGGDVTVTTPPENEPFEVPEAKLHLRVESDEGDDSAGDEDDEIGQMIVSARERLEHQLNRPLLPQTCTVRADGFPSDRILLWNDVTEVVSVDYTDADGAAQVLPATAFRLVDRAYLVARATWPAGEDISVTFKCGAFADPEAVPKSLCQWMKLQIGTMYEQRESETNDQVWSIPSRYVDGLIDRYRMLTL
ncbi:head-tail connector protein [Paraburkholderia saeva]|uniref:Phage gp6-like head-tail connector protein n=1 Tax=Paraburkholderia saeva TaxID=2777537 RepID=A0A9N8RZ27_9BURK|nr:hypothetical protein [Paraburkholderia saeva]CAG4906143.1 hypothetical protein LMG31841_03528 [Paraburkholderia saeva]